MAMNAERDSAQTPGPSRQPGLRERLTRIGHERAAGFLPRVESSLPYRCVVRFGAISGRDKAMLLAGEAFTTLIPLLIVVAATASQQGTTALADRLAVRFHVTGATAESIRILFTRPPGATGAITVAGTAVLLFSLLGLTRSFQNVYEAAWQLPARGVRGTLHGVTAFGLLISSLLVLSLLVGMLRGAPAGGVVAFVVRVLVSTAVWLVLQSLLLSRRIRIRRLLPGAMVGGAGSAVLSLYSALWMPRVIEGNAAEYGIIGITFAMLTWLIFVSFGVVVIAVLSAELGGAPELPRRAVKPGRLPGSSAKVALVRPDGSPGADEEGDAQKPDA